MDHVDEAALCYRAVLGCRPQESAEVAAPHGLVCSRALTDGQRRLRLALSVPVLGCTGARRRPPQDEDEEVRADSSASRRSAP